MEPHQDTVATEDTETDEPRNRPAVRLRAQRWITANWGLVTAIILLLAAGLSPDVVDVAFGRVQQVLVNNPVLFTLVLALLATSQAFRYLTTGLRRSLIVHDSGLETEPSAPVASRESEPTETGDVVDVEERIIVLSERLAELEARMPDANSIPLQRTPQDRLSQTERAQVLASVEAHWRSEMQPELLMKLSRDLATERDRVQTSAVRFELDRIRRRLGAEIAQLGRRSNLNLSIGIGTTVVAVSVLAYSVFTADVSLDNWRQALPNQLLRVTLAVFIEVFAFFFLRLYRANLDEIKFFQNELTNVEMRLTALRASFAIEKESAAAAVLDEVARTERNFILKKGESTVEIARLRAEGGTLRHALASGAQVLGGEKPRQKATE